MKRRILLIGSVIVAIGCLVCWGKYRQYLDNQELLSQSFNEIREFYWNNQENQGVSIMQESSYDAPLPYINSILLDEQMEMVEADDKIIDQRYEELLQKKKDGMKLDLVVFSYYKSETEVPAISRVSLTEAYYRIKHKVYQVQAGSAPVLSNRYLWKDNALLTVEHLVKDRQAFLALIKDQLLAKKLTEEKAESALKKIAALDPDYVTFRKDSLTISVDEEKVYLEFPFATLTGILNDDFRQVIAG